MNSMKRLISMALCLALLCGLCSLPASASDNNTNLSIRADKDSLREGETVRISISVSAMTVSSFAGGIAFDTDAFECVSIEGTRAESTSRIYLQNSELDWCVADSVSAVSEANVNGTVGFVWVGTSDCSYPAQEFAVVTLKAKTEGNTAVYLYEDSDGADGTKYDAEVSGDVDGTLSFGIVRKRTNIIISASSQTPGIGENVQITIAVESMTVSTFIAGITFDPTHLECVSIEGTREGKTERVYLQDSFEDWRTAASVSTVADANSTGTLGFAWTGTSDTAYPAQTFAVVTFKVISDGASEVCLYEDSDGANGKKYDEKQEDAGNGIQIVTAQLEVSVNFPDAVSAVVTITGAKGRTIVAALYDAGGRLLDVGIKESDIGSTELVLKSRVTSLTAAYCKIIMLDSAFRPISEVLTFQR